MADEFWTAIADVLSEARKARTADELIAAVKMGPSQDSGCADAFFAGSGGDTGLVEALDRSGWAVKFIEGDHRWWARSFVDGSTIEYIEGDVYKRRGSQ